MIDDKKMRVEKCGPGKERVKTQAEIEDATTGFACLDG